MLRAVSGFIFILCNIFLAGCGGSSEAQEQIIDDSIACTGFNTPDTNIFVRDSLDSGFLINSATVRVVSEDHTLGLIEDNLAEYIADDDNTSDTLTGAYYSPFLINSSEFNVSIVVSADGYHTFVTKGIAFNVVTSCGAENDLVVEVYLCPIGSACI